MTKSIQRSATSRTGAGSGSSKVLRIMVVDDHPIVRMGLKQLIDDQADMSVCCEAGDQVDALAHMRAARPDVAVVDLSLRESSGIELAKMLAVSYPQLRILMLSMHDERLYAERALRAGAHGFIMKEHATRDLLTAIRDVAAGGLYLSPGMMQRVVGTATGHGALEPSISGLDRLTDREREVFELLGKGRSTAEIADGLNLSVKTVETHRAHIKEKLGLKNATELIRLAALSFDQP